MNYQNIYNRIVEYRRSNKPNGYYETHHIVPKCMGGDDRVSNLVNLTAREHFICHLLLTKIHKDTQYYYKLVHAFMMMLVQSSNQQRYSPSRNYEQLKQVFALAQSKKQSGKGNSQFGTRWVHNLELKVSKKIGISDELEFGWLEGRVIKFKTPKLKTKKLILNLKKTSESKRAANKEKAIAKYRPLYKLYCLYGFEKMCELTGYTYSQQNFVTRCSRVLSEFVAQNGKTRGVK